MIVTGGVGQVGSWARFHRQVGHWLIALGAATAFNSVSSAAIFTNLADALPSLLPYVGKLHGGDPLSLFFYMDDSTVQTLLSRTEAQQADPALRNMRARAMSVGGTRGVA